MKFGTREISEDDLERVDFVLEKLSNFKIILQDRELRLCKFPMLNCDIDFTLDVYDMKHERYDVDERTVFLFFLEKDVGDEVELVEYYRFFRRIKAHRQMVLIIRRVFKFSQFEDCYSLFVRLEADYLQDLRERHSDPSEILNIRKSSTVTLNTFSNSLSLAIFNRMKELSPQLKKKQKGHLYLNPCVGIIHFLMEEYSSLELEEHVDFHGVEDLMPLQLAQRIEESHKCYHKGEETYMNIFVFGRSLEIGYGAHVEILVLRSNFFYTELRFGGEEMDFFRTNGKFVVQDFSELEETIYFLRFIYLRKKTHKEKVYIGDSIGGKLYSFPEDFLESHIRQMVFAEKYFECEYFELLLHQLMREKDISQSKIERALSNVGYLLHLDEELKETLIPILIESCRSSISNEKVLSKRNKFYELISKSFYEHEMKKMKSLIRRQDRKVSQYEEELEEKKKTISSMKESFDTFKMKQEQSMSELTKKMEEMKLQEERRRAEEKKEIKKRDDIINRQRVEEKKEIKKRDDIITRQRVEEKREVKKRDDIINRQKVKMENLMKEITRKKKTNSSLNLRVVTLAKKLEEIREEKKRADEEEEIKKRDDLINQKEEEIKRLSNEIKIFRKEEEREKELVEKLKDEIKKKD